MGLDEIHNSTPLAQAHVEIHVDGVIDQSGATINAANRIRLVADAIGK